MSFRRAGGFSLRAVQEGKYDHVDKGARICLLKSEDDGETWSDGTIIPAFDPERGEQDPSIQAFDDGMLMVNFFQWFVVPEEEKDRLKYPARQQIDGSWADVEGPFVIRSMDGGQTWEKEPVYADSAPLPRGGTSDAVIKLPNGDLMMGIYGADPGSGVCRAYSILSKDGGDTWGEPALIAKDPEGKISFEEPAIAITPDGNLIAMIRSGEPRKYQYLYQAFSYDMGKTWEGLEETAMWGHPAHVLQLRDGRMLCSYGYRREPFGIRASLSHDGGKTWDVANEAILRQDGGSRDLGYPCSVELGDGEILTVYYIHGDDGIRHIAGTKWNV
ncbi:MAG TPA: sialidase family protein [Anaerolineales bacterium]|nr:sialidase family protein [Anaerolineales bacterium]